MKTATVVSICLGSSLVSANTWFFEGYQKSNPSSGLCPNNPVTEGSGSQRLGCITEPEGVNCIRYDGGLRFALVMYESEDCSGTSTVRGPGAVGDLAFFSTFHSWEVANT
jgi:hypothetical protein